MHLNVGVFAYDRTRIKMERGLTRIEPIKGGPDYNGDLKADLNCSAAGVGVFKTLLLF